MARRTQAVYYRDETGREPVDDFLERLLAVNARAVAKIDHYVEEYLNGNDPSAPPPEHPISSQVEGELRELRVRFAKTPEKTSFVTYQQRSRGASISTV